MTQAYNLSQLANNLNTAGQLDATDGLVNAVPVANGGTGASTASAARTNLDVPTRAGTDASGVWNIAAQNIAGGGAGQIPYQTASNTTALLAAGTTGQVLQSNGTAAPSWVTFSSPIRTVVTKTATFTVNITETGTVFYCVAEISANLPSASSAGNGFVANFINAGVGQVTLIPNGGDLINRASSLVLPSGYTAILISDGSKWSTVSNSQATFPPTVVALTSTQTFTVPANIYTIRATVMGQAGGGGGTLNATTGANGGQGGAGGYAQIILNVTPGQTISCTISGAATAANTAGTATSFGTYVTAGGGGAGTGAGVNGTNGAVTISGATRTITNSYCQYGLAFSGSPGSPGQNTEGYAGCGGGGGAGFGGGAGGGGAGSANSYGTGGGGGGGGGWSGAGGAAGVSGGLAGSAAVAGVGGNGGTGGAIPFGYQNSGGAGGNSSNSASVGGTGGRGGYPWPYGQKPNQGEGGGGGGGGIVIEY